MQDQLDPAEERRHSRRWLVLVAISIAQLMVVLDATIVNIALPSAQADLGFSDDDRQWVVTAYALAFGGLLLLGGKLGDLFGRKRVFVVGLGGFALASVLGGFATRFAVLVGARALQGVFGALLAPAALSLLATTFTDPAERVKAFGIFGAIAGGGAAVGLLLGGLLTEYLSWRWCLYVNLAFAVPAILMGLRLIVDVPHVGARPKIDVPGVLTVSVGLFALVYGFAEAETSGWSSGVVIGCLVAAVVLIGAFIAIQARSSHPLLPLRIVRDRDRGGSLITMALSGAGMFGVFLFLTYYLQQTLGFSPVVTGVAFLPLVGGIMLSSTTVGPQLQPRIGIRPLIAGGMLLGGIGLLLFTRLGLDSSYWPDVLVPLVVMGLGLGLVFSTAISSSTAGVEPADAGVGSAMVNTVQQVGGSVGTALLNTLFSSAVADSLATGGASRIAQAQAQIDGYTTVFWWAAGIFAIGAIATGLLLRGGVRELEPSAEPAFAH